ncbi:MAG: UMP kinase [Thermoplasmata archaeon]
MEKLPVVSVSVGGSVTVPKDGSTTYLKNLSAMLREVSKNFRLIIVVGGGWIARWYISIAREMGQDECTLDEIGIYTTRINAMMLIAGLKDYACPFVPVDINSAVALLNDYPVVIMGGTHPGHTTDGVAVMAGEKSKAIRIVISTNVDGVYTKDPNRYSDAKKLEKITAEELLKITADDPTGAGSSMVIDALGCRIIHRAKIPTIVCDGRNLTALKAAIEGKDSGGTIILPA